ncbi:5-oxoprolinase subunit PxpA [Singulisphaera acidiphila]|uniref:Putative lactam utilization protein B-like protein n=1 Tax=Singulisphaera acidiphila (strain ATCC BAA-1392 / DSM 18658 / VKM B-2454 / MOB10) TaxID=886293 RepID=L0DCE0_SINAD|nr:5-oxoprolinase subunit PxpA [Singulisphaera acidiphila]AGA26882.1 putative lactam utilization protein B-like protein [Singulisphaera acidiphila DSM 18658]
MNPPSIRSIDLNADLGEGFPNDRVILDFVTSASVCCGAHAADRAVILETLREVAQHHVILGAHPGFADRDHFGRREQVTSARAVEQLVLGQVDALALLAAEVGLVIQYVKPHGALYNQAQRQAEVAEGVLSAMVRLQLPVLGQPGSLLEASAKVRGVPFVIEGFPDRRYRDDGRLVPRSEPNAILNDSREIESQVLRLVDDGVASFCIHGDDPRAVENARTIRTLLEQHAIVLKGFV